MNQTFFVLQYYCTKCNKPASHFCRLFHLSKVIRKNKKIYDDPLKYIISGGKE